MKRIAITLAALTAVAGTVMGMSPASAAANITACVAHRGGTEVATENTLNAVRSSSSPWVETDVQFTSDGAPVIMHDSTVDRTTNGTGAVADMTLAQLRTYRTSDGQYVPTLYEFLKATGTRHVFVELKTVPTAAQMRGFDARFTWLGAWNRTVVTSFLPDALDEAKATGHTTGLITSGPITNQEVRAYGTYLLENHNSVTAARVTTWHAAGIKVFGWTVDEKAEQLRMKWDHADGTITNNPNACSVV